RRTTERRAHLCKPAVCVRSPGGGTALAPADGAPVRRMAPDREARPALPNPPGPPSRVDRAAAQLGPVLATAAPGPVEAEERSPSGSPLHGRATQGTARSVGAPAASSLVLAGAAGRLDPASRAGGGLRR